MFDYYCNLLSECPSRHLKKMLLNKIFVELQNVDPHVLLSGGGGSENAFILPGGYANCCQNAYRGEGGQKRPKNCVHN